MLGTCQRHALQRTDVSWWATRLIMTAKPIRARLVVQVHPGPPFKSPVNTRRFSLSSSWESSSKSRQLPVSRVGLHSGRSEATQQDAAIQNLKIDAGMRSNNRGDVRRKYRDEPNHTSTVANPSRARQNRGSGRGPNGGGLLIHPDLFAQTNFRLFC